MDNELSFGTDCVIKLEDLGEFKDYSDTIDALFAQLNQLKSKQKSLFCPQLKEVLEADPEDTFYIPKFKQLLEIIIRENWLKCPLKDNELKIIIKFQMLIVEQCLLSFTFSEQSLKNLLQKCRSYQNIIFFQQILLTTLFRLSDKVVYIEDEQSVLSLWSLLDDIILFDQKSHETNNMKIALYLQSCEKFTRNHRIRRKLNTLSLSNKIILKIKLSLWNRDKIAIQDCLQHFETNKYFGSQFLRKSIKLLEEQCQQ